MHHNRSQAGFTLIELIVVVSILAILAGAMIPRVTERVARSRDARRLADIQAVKQALDTYYADKGQYPDPNANPAFGGWDVTHDDDFVSVLRDEGYLPEDARDPINDDTYHYRYFVYAAGTYGCVGATKYYVLGIRNFETPDFANEHKGFFKCSGRDWSNEFAYVTGGGASFK